MSKLALLLALVVGFGCSSEGGGDTGVTADKACTDLAAALCDRIQTCAPPFAQLTYGDIATCQTRAKLDCMQSASAPSTASTPTDIAACASAAKTLQCGPLFANDLPAACAPKSGALADGAACLNDSQCKSSFCALDNDKETCGVCQAKPTENGACAKGKCPLGLVCSLDDSTCVKPVPIGGACDPKKVCVTGSHCFDAKCVADSGSEGAACGGTAGPDCDGLKGLLCVTNKCTKYTIVKAGAECGAKIEAMKVTGVLLCEKGGWCKGFDAATGKFTGTCEAAAADGQPCSAEEGKGPGCLEPAECIGGKCTLPDAATCK